MATLEQEYTERHTNVLTPLASRLELFLKKLFKDTPRIDRIGARPKAIVSFLGKAAKTLDDGTLKYTDPLNQIQDQLGARVVGLYLSDVEQLAAVVTRYFRAIETRTVVPDSESEFGYFGKHFILILPSDLYDDAVPKTSDPPFFELQIKTVFQHAWGEAEHDLGYKTPAQLSSDHKRRIAFCSAQAWGADRIFNELYGELAPVRK